MFEYIALHKLRLLLGTTIICAGLLLLALIISSASKTSWQASTPDVYSMGSGYDGSNVVTGALSGAGSTIMRTATAFGDGASATFGTIGRAFAGGGRGIGNGFAAIFRSVGGGLAVVGRGVGTGFLWTGHTLISNYVFMFKLPATTVGYVFNPRIMAAVIQPVDHTKVPIIDPASPDLAAAKAALPATAPVPTAQVAPAVQAVPTVTPQWPLHGAITTQFGASDWPYQAVHTGIDISDGRGSGVSPIHPFRPGTVVQVIHSSVSLGNHVVIDHGNGVTSVYGHMSSTAVSVGQVVDESTMLGYEGSTGASTGPHLHFEIRVNGQATNPHQFIAGQPY